MGQERKTEQLSYNSVLTEQIFLCGSYNTDTGSETDQKRVAIEELEDSNRNIKSLCRWVLHIYNFYIFASVCHMDILQRNQYWQYLSGVHNPYVSKSICLLL